MQCEFAEFSPGNSVLRYAARIFATLVLLSTCVSSPLVAQTSSALFNSCAVIGEAVLQLHFDKSTYAAVPIQNNCAQDFYVEVVTYFKGANGGTLGEGRAAYVAIGGGVAVDNLTYFNTSAPALMAFESVHSTQHIVNVWETESVDLDSCLNIINHNSRLQDQNAVITSLYWGAQLHNSCDRALDVSIDYEAYDSSGALLRTFRSTVYPIPENSSRTITSFSQSLSTFFDGVDHYVPLISIVRPFVEDIQYDAHNFIDEVIPTFDVVSNKLSLAVTDSNAESYQLDLLLIRNDDQVQFSIDTNSIEKIDSAPVASGSYIDAEGKLVLPALKLSTGERFNSIELTLIDSANGIFQLTSAQEGIEFHDYRASEEKCVEVRGYDSQISETPSQELNLKFSIELFNSCLTQLRYGLVYKMLDEFHLGEYGLGTLLEIPPEKSTVFDFDISVPLDQISYAISRESVQLAPLD